MKINEFTNDAEKFVWIAADTETHTFIDGEQVSEAEMLELGKTHGVDFFRDHTVVSVYAWLISDGTRFAWLETFDEFLSFCAMHRVDAVWWYNAKFDFACIDWYLLDDPKFSRQDEGRQKPFTWRSLHSNFGARYCLSICYPYKLSGKGNNHLRNHTTRHYDFCNLFGGGLAQVLKDFDVTDYNGRKIRKLEMDYQATEITDEAVAYMRNDVDGLYHAVRIADDFLRDNFDRRIAGAKPDVMTAGGLAKKTLLRHIYGGDDQHNVRAFKAVHRIGLAQDEFYRLRGLYRGGLCIVNPKWANRVQNVPMWRYDVNSMYPAQMHKMPDVQGIPTRISYDDYQRYKRNDFVYIFEIGDIHGYLNDGYLPVYYDVETKRYQDKIHFTRENFGRNLLMFDFEWNELARWYTADIEITGVLAFYAPKIDGYTAYVDKYYAMKADGKKEKNKLKQAFAKLCLNSAYGKLAENPRRDRSHREINPETQAVHLVMDGRQYDEKVVLSIVQGALVTAMSRTFLLSEIRAICKEKPAEYFVYCDTDSIHAVQPYDRCDPYKLGALKDETDGKPFNFWKYLAPKTYFDGHVENGVVTDIEMHTKGVTVKTVMADIIDHYDGENPVYKTPAEIDNVFRAGVKFQPLSGMNVPGGKALIPIAKYMCNESNAVCFNGDELIEREYDPDEILPDLISVDNDEELPF